MAAWLSPGVWPQTGWEASVRKPPSDTAPPGGSAGMGACEDPWLQNNDKLPTDGVSHGSGVPVKHLQTRGQGPALLGWVSRRRSRARWPRRSPGGTPAITRLTPESWHSPRSPRRLPRIKQTEISRSGKTLHFHVSFLVQENTNVSREKRRRRRAYGRHLAEKDPHSSCRKPHIFPCHDFLKYSHVQNLMQKEPNKL